MDIGKKIYELRKQNHITQEQLANAVGVSTPAVCKWETGVSLPDISLLPPIARMLHTNIDDLLSFQDSLTESTLEEIMKQIIEEAKERGFDSAVELGEKYLKQYPGNEELKLRIAMSPSSIAYVLTGKNLEEDSNYQDLLNRYTIMLEELASSNTQHIRISAMGALIGRYMASMRFDEAEAMLNKIPEQNYGTAYLLPHLYLKKGELNKSLACAQKNMQKDIQGVLMDIRAQHTVYLQSKQFDKALKCAEDFLVIVRIVKLKIMFGNELLVDTYLEMKDFKNAEKYFIEYIDEIMDQKLNLESSFYFSEIDLTITEKQDLERKRIFIQMLLNNDKYKQIMQSETIAKKLKDIEKSLVK